MIRHADAFSIFFFFFRFIAAACPLFSRPLRFFDDAPTLTFTMMLS